MNFTVRFYTIVFALSILNLLQFGDVFTKPYILSERSISLEKRQQDRYVNSVMKYNILLNLAYLKQDSVDLNNIREQDIDKSFQWKLVLKPNQTFAYHDEVLENYKKSDIFAKKIHFNSQQGFKSDGYLVGDGVCHLASIIKWVAQEAGLTVVAPTNHNFAVIPEIPQKHGVAIYYQPANSGISANQNLYITNNTSTDITFVFDYVQNGDLKVTVLSEEKKFI